MRKKLLDDKFYMPSQIDLGTAEKEDTSPTETPYPLAKGSDGLPKFNELQDAQKRNMPKAMRSQVAFQQKKLQYSNYQIVNIKVVPTDSVASVGHFFSDYNRLVAVGTQMDDAILFGTTTADVTRAKYYNIVYANVRFSQTTTASVNIEPSSFVEFYLMQKLDTGDCGGKIPRQIEAITNPTNVTTFYSQGAEFGTQSFGVDVYNENAYYTQSPDLKGMRSCGLALKQIVLNFDTTIQADKMELMIEIGIDLKTEGNNL